MKKQGPQKHGFLKSLKIQHPPPLKTVELPWKDQKWLLFQILGGKTEKIGQIDSQTTEIWPKKLNIKLSESESVCDTLVREKLSF